MELKGDTLIPAPRESVWRALNDPEILRQSIPGCETIEKSSETEMTATVVAKVGPVKASFNGKVTLSDLDPPNGYRITGEGKGGAAGFAKGGATVQLSDAEDGGTLLSYQVDAQVGGKLAQIGSRLIDGAAKSLAKDFFEKFSALVAAQEAAKQPDEAAIADAVARGELPAPPPEMIAPAENDEAVAMDVAARQSRILPPWIWVGGIIVIIAALLALINAR